MILIQKRNHNVERYPDCGTICSDAVPVSLACAKERAVSASVGVILLRKTRSTSCCCVSVSHGQ